MIRLGIIEDDEHIRKMLINFFSDCEGITCVLTASSVEEFFDFWGDSMHFDVVLSDIGLPGESGIKGLAIIKKRSPKTQVLMLTVYDDSERVFQALCNGASGYLLKQTPLLKIKESIISLHDGGAPMSPGIARLVVQYFNPKKSQNLYEKLTARELQIVNLIEAGKTNKEVARLLDISIETVKYHIKNIYQKLEVNNRHAIISKKYKDLP